jgi:membrane-associated phospholipid phosphatase
MLVLGTLFFVGYPVSNYLASMRDAPVVPFFRWEHAVPFIAWSIVPYLSINILFPLSFFWCATNRDLNTHALRLLSVQLISYACFVFWPVANDRALPPLSGIEGWLYDTLLAFDRPFNMAPSLHVSVLIILVDLARRYSQGIVWALAMCWATAILLSTQTTWQHHLFDVVSGAALGGAALFAFRWKANLE